MDVVDEGDDTALVVLLPVVSYSRRLLGKMRTFDPLRRNSIDCGGSSPDWFGLIMRARIQRETSTWCTGHSLSGGSGVPLRSPG